MTDELTSRIGGIAAEAAALLPALDRTAPIPAVLDVPGRLSRLAGAVGDWQRASWSEHLDGARRLDREIAELAAAVRAAGTTYRMVERDRGRPL
ncbi:hypothetical protein [Catellatospora chokoriensis]|uniref:Uncharacterized protein n=1 Tax=Catellatospora chokoriensis TaxID=310353 RepID=A0A8J3K4N9_9ACTN|nr:hypothetical protein [Catellatospora chokoriensis]GIF90630.1 hypothetical protein Cch02nite_40740 [Catellatospora chokoriensis]